MSIAPSLLSVEELKELRPAPKIKRITPEEAMKERAERELAKRHYAEFRRYIMPRYVDGPHNGYTAQKLEQVELYVRTGGKEGIGRLMINMPPQYGKSTDAARIFPAWFLGRNPNLRVIIASYAASLADKHSAAVRNYIQSQRYQNIFGRYSTIDIPVDVSDTSGARNDWDLGIPYNGGCVSAGIEGGLSGKGADLLIADDTTKDAEEARSDLHQKKLAEWYDWVAFQRLSPAGAIIDIQTRWNPNDLTGQLLKRMGSEDPNADKWEVVFLPALALEESEYPQTPEAFRENLIRGVYIPMGGDQLGRTPGTALWPEKYSQEYLLKKKANTSPFAFASLDQQLPRESSGGMFDEKDIRTMEPVEIPERMDWYAYVDLALGQSKKSDFNSVYPFTMNPKNGEYIYRDLIHEREIGAFLKDLKTAMRDPINKRVIWVIEATAFQTLIFMDFRKDKSLVTVRMRKFYPQDAKIEAAKGLSSHAKEQPLRIVRQASNPIVIRELLDYPYVKNDDIVDTMSRGPYAMAKFGMIRESKIL